MGADSPARCAMVAHAFKEPQIQLQDTQDTRESLDPAYTELVNLKGLTETQFKLIEQLWALLSSYNQVSGETLRQQQFSESILDAAIAQLNLQTAQMECELLRGENKQLWRLLEASQGEGEDQADLIDSAVRTR